MRSLRNLLLATSLLATSVTACAPGARGPADAAAPAVPVTRPGADANAIDRAALRTALAARRAESIDRFLAYREARVYPVNTFAPGLQHVWIDEQGNLCAAATIVAAAWGRAAAEAVAREDNFLRLADVDDGPLLDWMLTSGLTRHELVAIQEPMMEVGAPDRAAEISRLYAIYVSVERQLRSLWDDNLDAAVDALMAHPALARRLLDGELPGPGRYAAGA